MCKGFGRKRQTATVTDPVSDCCKKCLFPSKKGISAFLHDHCAITASAVDMYVLLLLLRTHARRYRITAQLRTKSTVLFCFFFWRNTLLEILFFKRDRQLCVKKSLPVLDSLPLLLLLLIFFLYLRQTLSVRM